MAGSCPPRSARFDERPEIPAADRGSEVIFMLDASSAKEVLVAGDFTDWLNTPVKLRRGAGGTWHTRVKLTPGRHCYRFLVDGHWQNDPNRSLRVPNPFGTFDNLLEIY